MGWHGKVEIWHEYAYGMNIDHSMGFDDISFQWYETWVQSDCQASTHKEPRVPSHTALRQTAHMQELYGEMVSAPIRHAR